MHNPVSRARIRRQIQHAPYFSRLTVGQGYQGGDTFGNVSGENDLAAQQAAQLQQLIAQQIAAQQAAAQAAAGGGYVPVPLPPAPIGGGYVPPPAGTGTTTTGSGIGAEWNGLSTPKKVAVVGIGGALVALLMGWVKI